MSDRHAHERASSDAVLDAVARASVRDDEATSALVVGAPGLGRLLDCSERHVRALNSSGRIPRPIALGRRRLWSVAEVSAWLAAGAPARALWESRRREGAHR